MVAAASVHLTVIVISSANSHSYRNFLVHFQGWGIEPEIVLHYEEAA
ncbi:MULTISPECIES: hypothetical protein [Geobacillus]|nr:hypothetical protein [Geobacillus genomosp. 3]